MLLPIGIKGLLDDHGLAIFWSEPGEISEKGCWVCLDSEGYLYMGDSLAELIQTAGTEWKQDQHLVG